MQIPKHLTQVGTISSQKRVYIEDYCISYVKQLVREEPEKKKQIALYGNVEQDNGRECCFVMGACLLGTGSERTDSLTPVQRQEAEEKRMEFFHGMQLVGLIMCEDSYQEKLYYIGSGNKSIGLDGFYIYYDKNECMLNYMMTEQKAERAVDMDPVIVKKAEMDRVKEEKESQEILQGNYRKQLLAERKESPEYAQKNEKKKGGFSLVACCLLLLIGGVYTLKEYYPNISFENVEKYVSAFVADSIVIEESEDSIVESEETILGVSQVEEDRQQEEENRIEDTVDLPEGLMEIVIPDIEDVKEQVEEDKVETEICEETEIGEETEITIEVDSTVVNLESESYQIQKGDNLLNILRRHYGDDSKLDEVCIANGIVEPDNIQVGQTILLP